MLGCLKHRLRHIVFPTKITDATNAGSDVLHRVHSVQHSEQQWIARHAPSTQLCFRDASGQPTRADNLQPVREQIDLYIGSGAVITVSQSIDGLLAKRLCRPDDLPSWEVLVTHCRTLGQRVLEVHRVWTDPGAEPELSTRYRVPN